MRVKCFMVEMTDQAVRRVGMIRMGNDRECSAGKFKGAVCRAEAVLRTFTRDPENDEWPEENQDATRALQATLKTCDACGGPIDNNWSPFASAGNLWRRVDTGEMAEKPEKFGPGGIWRAPWMTSYLRHTWDNWPEGEAPLIVQTPGGPWVIDSRANNCTLPQDRLHRCWVRHGTPPDLHVDKNGLTCSAGAGSIVSGDFHGFLHDGHLFSC